jgi:hypothetical protein
MELAACTLIGVGVLMLLQHLALTFAALSIVTMLAGTVAFMIVSKFPSGVEDAEIRVENLKKNSVSYRRAT